MNTLMEYWPALTVAVAGLFLAGRLLPELLPSGTQLLAPSRAVGRAAVPIHVDPTVLEHLRPGAGSLASLPTEEEAARMAEEERVKAEALAAEQAAAEYFADFRAALDDAVEHFRRETRTLDAVSRIWHMDNGHTCETCDPRAELNRWRAETSTGEWPIVFGTAKVPGGVPQMAHA